MSAEVKYHDIPERFLKEHSRSLKLWLSGARPCPSMGFTTRFGEVDLIKREYDDCINIYAEREYDQEILDKFK